MPKIRTAVESIAYNMAIDFLKKAKDARKKGDEFSEFKHSLVSILLAFISLEAFINLIGSENVPSTVWSTVEKLSTYRKCILIPQLVSGKTFDLNAEPYKSFRRLNKLRNDMIHYKVRWEPCEREKMNAKLYSLDSKDAEDSIETVKKMEIELLKLMNIEEDTRQSYLFHLKEYI